jgi:hypothetical protein
MMTEQIEGHPARGRERYHDPDVLIQYSPKFEEYGIIVHDGGESYVVFQFCPWCGTRLPESKRDLWFDTLQGLGLDPLHSVDAGSCRPGFPSTGRDAQYSRAGCGAAPRD